MKAEKTVSESPSEAEARRGDGLLVVLQNNELQTVTIHRMNTVIEALLGYENGQIISRDLDTILGARTAQLLKEDLEFDDEAPDLGEILLRQREIYLKHRQGHEVKVLCTVSRMMAEGTSASFQLVIPNQRDVLAKQKIRDFVALNFEGRKQLDEASGLPNHATAQEFLPFLKNYLAESEIEASFSVIRIDRHAKNLARYGKPGANHLLQHAANCCRAAFRAEDMIFALSDHTLGLLLFDISRESARIVLNRLRWAIRNHHIEFGGKSSFSVTTTIAFDMLTVDTGDALLARCEEAIATVDVDERNSLIELAP